MSLAMKAVVDAFDYASRALHTFGGAWYVIGDTNGLEEDVLESVESDLFVLFLRTCGRTVAAIRSRTVTIH